jgi:hypothetical protein
MSPSTRSKKPEPTSGAKAPPDKETDPMSPTRIAAAAALAATVATAAAAPAANVTTDASAPAHVRKYVSDVRLSGSGRFAWFGFHVYDAALFVPPGFDPATASDQPFVLELTYARRLEGKGIAETSRDEIGRLGFGDEAQRVRWHEQMVKLFPDVEKGRKLAGVNVPGRGARFYFDGQFLGSIDDPAFARAFFAIWLDSRTRAPQLRESLLKGAAPVRTASL